MGRRSIHSPDQLRELILQAATEVIEHDGLAGLSAREVARRIGYSPGTLYNMYQNLDDLVLTIEARLLDRLAGELAAIPPANDPHAHVAALARAYLQFTHANPKLWNLLFEHHMPPAWAVPPWYQQKLENLLGHVEQALAPIVGTHDPVALKKAARVLWAGVHGITSLSTADKLSSVTHEAAGALVEDLVRTYLAGLEARHCAEPRPT